MIFLPRKKMHLSRNTGTVPRKIIKLQQYLIMLQREIVILAPLMKLSLFCITQYCRSTTALGIITSPRGKSTQRTTKWPLMIAITFHTLSAMLTFYLTIEAAVRRWSQNDLQDVLQKMAFRHATLLKRDSNTGVSLWILRNF